MPRLVEIQSKLGAYPNRELLDIYTTACVQSASDETLEVRTVTKAEILHRMRAPKVVPFPNKKKGT
jgi:hypothetical protein